VTLNIGQRVQVVNIRPKSLNGKLGTITSLNTVRASVKMDDDKELRIPLQCLLKDNSPQPLPKSLDAVKSNLTKQQVLDMVNKINNMPADAFDAVDNLISELDEKAGKGLNIGRVLYFRVADGYAKYVVTNIGKQNVTVVHLAVDDAWQDNYVVVNNKVLRVNAERQIRQNDASKNFFQNNAHLKGRNY
jgi:hypothetical protein